MSLRSLPRLPFWDNVDDMACEEKQRLGGEYEATTKKFSDAVTKLQRKMGTSQKTTMTGSPAPQTKPE